MHEHLKEIDGEFKFAIAKDANTVDDIQVFLDESVAGNVT
jgi:hypothetical protein